MRILLVGEYSHFHNSLQRGLRELGHEVVLVSDNDFKDYPVDINLFARHFINNFFLNALRQLIYRFVKSDIAQYEVALRFWFNRKKLRGFDVIQLVNEYAIQSPPKLEIKLLSYLFRHNGPAFLVACGDDYLNVSYALAGKQRYSVLTPCEEFPDANHCKFTLKYVREPFRKLHGFVYAHVKGVVAGDLDYYQPLVGNPKFQGLIPYPIIIPKFEFKPNIIHGKIIIFHGINEANYYKKGNYIFEKALDIILAKYADKIEVITTKSVPYPEYIKLYDSAHIVLDQVFSYDQGYNALEAMAKGKVVFTGAESEFMDFYALHERVAVNALPDAKSIADELISLIENPEEISAIGKRARAFVEKEHDYKKIAAKYIAFWTDQGKAR